MEGYLNFLLVMKKVVDGRAFTAGPNFGVKAACNRSLETRIP
jgi:hypothetical protein